MLNDEEFQIQRGGQSYFAQMPFKCLLGASIQMGKYESPSERTGIHRHKDWHHADSRPLLISILLKR